MIPKITVQIDDDIPYHYPVRTRWHLNCKQDCERWQCIIEINDWLIDNEIEHYIFLFNDDIVLIDIPSDEARVMVKLSWPQHQYLTTVEN